MKSLNRFVWPTVAVALVAWTALVIFKVLTSQSYHQASVLVRDARVLHSDLSKGGLIPAPKPDIIDVLEDADDEAAFDLDEKVLYFRISVTAPIETTAVNQLDSGVAELKRQRDELSEQYRREAQVLLDAVHEELATTRSATPNRNPCDGSPMELAGSSLVWQAALHRSLAEGELNRPFRIVEESRKVQEVGPPILKLAVYWVLGATILIFSGTVLKRRFPGERDAPDASWRA